MITQKQFKSLQNFRIGSWAIWGKERQINSEYFKKDHQIGFKGNILRIFH